MIGLGVVGFGYWGPTLARNAATVPGGRLVSICDQSPERLLAAGQAHPGVKLTADPRELVSDPSVHAVLIATPVNRHFEVAWLALDSGKHVLIEKPITSSSEEARRLIALAREKGLVLLVDHTPVYTGAVRKMREIVASGAVGDVLYYDSTRVNLGLFRHDVDVFWDLAVHDLAILQHVVPQRPVAVSATGIAHVEGEPANLAWLTLFFDGPLIAHVSVNWLAPVKLRRTLVGGTRKMIVLDDLEPSEKVKVYDKGITVTAPEGEYQLRIGYRSGDMAAPFIDPTDALRTEFVHFLACIDGRETPLTGGEAGLRVVEILEAASRSVQQRGNVVELPRADEPQA